MGFWSGVGEAGHWVYEVVKTPVVGVKYTVQSLSSCPAYAVGLTDGGRCFFNWNRFKNQIYKSGVSVVLSKGKNNPISQITEIVLKESKKNNPKQYEKTLAKYLVKKKIKKATVDILVKEISSSIIDFFAVKYFAGKAVSGTVSGIVSAGIGGGLTVASIVDESYNSAMRLKQKNHIIYSKLFAKNLECFWFLVESELGEFVY